MKLDESVNLREVAAITSGFVGADLANLVNEGALLAARKGKTSVGMEEFNEGVERVTAGLEKRQRIIHEDEKLRVAFHESGHALVAYCLPNTDPVHKVSIIPRGLAALGYTLQRPRAIATCSPRASWKAASRYYWPARAPRRWSSRTSRPAPRTTWNALRAIARSMVMDFGMSRLGRVNFRESNRSPFLAGGNDFQREHSHSEQTAREIDEEVKRVIDESFDRVRHILETRMSTLKALSAGCSRRR